MSVDKLPVNLFDIVLVQMKGGAIAALTQDGEQHDNFPQWSPNGQWIAFTSDRSPDHDFRIYLIRPDGTGLHALTNAPGDAHCIWSPERRLDCVCERTNGLQRGTASQH